MPKLVALASQHTKIYLSVPVSDDNSAQLALVAGLEEHLPEDSSVHAHTHKERDRITIEQLLPRAVILQHLECFHDAALAYKHLANAIMPRLYEKLGLPRETAHWDRNTQIGQLDKEWHYFFHGAHCALSNRRTGQSIEASLWFEGEFGVLDPYFFSKFLRAEPGFDDIARLVTDDFHDGHRILEVLEQEGRLILIKGRIVDGTVAKEK